MKVLGQGEFESAATPRHLACQDQKDWPLDGPDCLHTSVPTYLGRYLR